LQRQRENDSPPQGQHGEFGGEDGWGRWLSHGSSLIIRRLTATIR
jgi:hypothetical protein